MRETIVYQAADGARGHVTGAWYFSPMTWNVSYWSFSRPHETEEQAREAAAEWAGRFKETG